TAEGDAARRGTWRLDDRPPECRLAAARLADEPDGLASRDVERDVRDRVHPAALARVVLHDELIELQEGRVGVRGRGRPISLCGRHDRSRSVGTRDVAIRTGASIGYQHATSCGTLPSSARNGGSSSRQRSCAYAHLGAKLQPTGRFTRSGGRPGITGNGVWLLSASRGIGPYRASVYGIFMAPDSV